MNESTNIMLCFAHMPVSPVIGPNGSGLELSSKKDCVECIKINNNKEDN